MSRDHGFGGAPHGTAAEGAADLPTRRGRTREGPRGTAKDRALRLLGVRWRSRVELERRLKQAGFPEDEISAALEDLERTGLIDDERFARELVRDQAGRRMAGDRAIRSALRTKGVAPDVVERAVAADPSEEGDRALQLARRRAARMGNLPPEVAFRRLQGLLVRRGFGPGLSRDMARRALDGVDDDGMGIEPSDPD